MEKGERYQADLDTSHQFSSRQVSPFQFENRTIHPRYTKLFQLVCRKRNLHPTTFKNYKSGGDG